MLIAVISTISAVVGIIGFTVTEVRHIRNQQSPSWLNLAWPAVALVAVALAAWAWERDRDRTAVAAYAERVLLGMPSYSDGSGNAEHVLGQGISFFSAYRARFPDLAEHIRALEQRVDADLPLPEDEFDTRAQNEYERRLNGAAARVIGMLDAVAEGDADDQ